MAQAVLNVDAPEQREGYSVLIIADVPTVAVVVVILALK
jgi:hypothetical protein